MDIQKLIRSRGLGEKISRGRYNLIYRLGDSNLVVKFKKLGGQEWRPYSENECLVSR
ncbi:MAG: hypothetical protein KKB31_04060 [Nanoarchaeota archaeon]|nr:hypothetical protein [Nanoarchaeota archaeon]